MKFTRYLDAKKPIERKSLNPAVLDEVRSLLEERTEPKVLEVGAGTGSMPIHLSERGVLPEGTMYTALDKDRKVLERARMRLSEHRPPDSIDGTVKVGGAEVEFAEKSLYDETGEYDLVIAHAFLDLLSLGDAVEHLLGISEAFYFPVCFDGVTAFEPPYDDDLDARIEGAYHRTMDERSGGSETGRRVFGAVRKAGGTVTEAGSSDWVVFPDEDGYTDEEKYMLRYIVETVQDAVSEEPEIEEDRLEDWAEDRRNRIRKEELVYIAHQIDLAGRSN